MSHARSGLPAHRALADAERRRGASRRFLLSLLVPAVLGCFSATAGCKGDLPLSKAEPTDEPPPEVPVPPEDGPKLVMLSGTTVYDRPATNGRVLGDLRAGAVVVRAAKPYSSKGCEAGWYPIRPRGFVCAGATDPSAQAAALPSPPDRSRPLPYRYGRARYEGVPLYRRLPTAAEQLAAEPDLTKHLARVDEGADRDLGPAANDVPLDARGVPKGPPVLLPGGDGIDSASHRPAATYFVFADTIAPPIALPPAEGAELSAGVLRKNSGVAITNSLLAGSDESARRFGVTPDGRYVPIDRLRPALGMTWHGIDLEKSGLPVAFVHRNDTSTWQLGKGKAVVGEEQIERRVAVPLTGRFRTVDGVRFEEAKEGFWLRAKDLIVVVRRTKLPEFAKGTQKWLDVSLATQTLTAYEGTKPVYATLMSSGRDQLGDPAQGKASTARGSFRVRRKYVAMPIDSREVDGFDVADAPWGLELGDGLALTGCYWGDPVGEAQGFHNVTLSPVDAHRIWTWAAPVVPEGWNSVVDDGGETTMVHVRP